MAKCRLVASGPARDDQRTRLQGDLLFPVPGMKIEAKHAAFVSEKDFEN
jgi:hypothetical protein